jgi:2-oxoisovalerate dehydrogenase E1 component
VLILTEETLRNSFAEALAGRISQVCFRYLDAPIKTMGSADVPAVPLNASMEAVMLPNADKVESALRELLES